MDARAFTVSLPKLLAFAALVGALVALVDPLTPEYRAKAPAAAPKIHTDSAIKPAVYTSGERSPEMQDAWVQLMVTFELVRSSQEVLEEAQSLRAIAAALAAGSADTQSNHELAEGQLALAEKVLTAAQAHAANSQAAFGLAWQNVLRASREEALQDPGEQLHQSALHGRRPG